MFYFVTRLNKSCGAEINWVISIVLILHRELSVAYLCAKAPCTNELQLFKKTIRT